MLTAMNIVAFILCMYSSIVCIHSAAEQRRYSLLVLAIVMILVAMINLGFVVEDLANV